jgi:hypothetical protein
MALTPIDLDLYTVIILISLVFTIFGFYDRIAYIIATIILIVVGLYTEANGGITLDGTCITSGCQIILAYPLSDVVVISLAIFNMLIFFRRS